MSFVSDEMNLKYGLHFQLSDPIAVSSFGATVLVFGVLLHINIVNVHLQHHSFQLLI